MFGYHGPVRIPGSIAIAVIVAGCVAGPKPPPRIEIGAPEQAPATTGAAPPVPSPVDSPAADASRSESAVASESASPPAPPLSPDPTPAGSGRQPTAAETRRCAARGGTIQPVCMAGELACVVRYRDGGKRCSDKRDCTGECLYEGNDPAPEKAIGACQRTSDPCGCKAVVHDGHVEPTLCAD